VLLAPLEPLPHTTEDARPDAAIPLSRLTIYTYRAWSELIMHRVANLMAHLNWDEREPLKVQAADRQATRMQLNQLDT
jgi:hypothetical protein